MRARQCLAARSGEFVPLSQRSFLLGVIFLLFTLFALGGIARLVSRVRARRPSK